MYLTNNQKMSQLNKALVCIHTAKYYLFLFIYLFYLLIN